MCLLCVAPPLLTSAYDGCLCSCREPPATASHCCNMAKLAWWYIFENAQDTWHNCTGTKFWMEQLWTNKMWRWQSKAQVRLLLSKKYNFCCRRTEVELLFSKSRSVKSRIVTSDDAQDFCSSQMEDTRCWKLKGSLHCTEPFHDPKHPLNGKWAMGYQTNCAPARPHSKLPRNI